MHTRPFCKIALVSLIALLTSLSFTYAQQRRGYESQVITGNPPGLVKKVDPQFPADIALHGGKGRGRFRLTINPQSGQVDEVKVVQSTGFKTLNELAAKALFQWQFQPGSHSPVEVPVEFYIHGGTSILH